MSIDGHKQTDVMEDCKNFFKKLEELKQYIVKFKKNSIIKLKIYTSNNVVKRDK